MGGYQFLSHVPLSFYYKRYYFSPPLEHPSFSHTALVQLHFGSEQKMSRDFQRLSVAVAANGREYKKSAFPFSRMTNLQYEIDFCSLADYTR